MEALNRRLLTFCHSWTANSTHRSTPGVETLYYLDQGTLHDGLLRWNVQRLGFQNDSVTATADKLSHITNPKAKNPYFLTVAHVCEERVPHNTKDCLRNALTADGTHFCMNIIGPTLAAGMSCQFQCAFAENDLQPQASWDCAQECNQRFMNISHILKD